MNANWNDEHVLLFYFYQYKLINKVALEIFLLNN